MHYRVAPGVYVVGGVDLSSPYDNNVYLISLANDEFLLYDSGSPWGVLNIIRNIMELGYSLRRLRYVIISHAHIESSGGAHMIYWINKDVETVAHEPDSTRIRQGDPVYTNACEYNTGFPSYPISLSLHENTKNHVLSKDPSIEILHTPGHTKGLITLVYDDGESRIAFISDALGPLCDLWLSSEEELEETLEILVGLDCMKYCSSTTCYSRREFNVVVETIVEKGVSSLRVQCCGKKYG